MYGEANLQQPRDKNQRQLQLTDASQQCARTETDQLEYFGRFAGGSSESEGCAVADAAAAAASIAWASCSLRGLPGPRRSSAAVAAWDAAAAVTAALCASCSCCCCTASAALMGLKKRSRLSMMCVTDSATVGACKTPSHFVVVCLVLWKP